MYVASKTRPVIELEHALRDLDRVSVWNSKALSAEITSLLTGMGWSHGALSGSVMIHQGRTSPAPDIVSSVDAIFEVTGIMGFRPGSLTSLLSKAIEIMPRWMDKGLSEREALPVAMTWLLLTEEVLP